MVCGAAGAWPDLPVPIKNGAGARIGSTLYVGLGSAGKSWYAMDTSAPERRWVQLASFPDSPRDAASTVAVGGQIYVFAGSGKIHPEDKTLQIFDSAYRYDPASDKWSRLPTRTPLGLLAAAATTLDQTNVLFFGGVNKQIFDGFFIDNATAGDDKDATAAVAKAYFDQRPEDYFFTAQVLSYNVITNQWRNLGADPYRPTVGAAVATRGDEVTLVGGEVKPGLRSREAKSVVMRGDALQWHNSALPVPKAGEQQEGVAGAFAGYSHGALIVAGGANFPGAWKQFDGGQNWANKGLHKTWRDEVYVLERGQWKATGKLPHSLGYGNGFEVDGGLLIVGGETQDGTPSQEVFMVRWDGREISVQR
jgi:N-acetylneuraminate epimerase